MAYTPINWQTGDTITAEKMNKMDNGWSVTSGVATLCDETVITEDDGGMYVGSLSISSITASTITVTYDSTAYQCTQDGDGGYGDDVNFTFSDYPFRIESDGFIVTQTGGAHTVKIETVVTAIETSQNFADASASVAPVFQIIIHKTTWQQVYDAVSSGKIVYVVDDEADYKTMRFVANVGISSLGSYHIEMVEIGSNEIGIANYYANSANDPIYPD